ncbi:MAG: 50S ribosomal protein L4 [Candidatus Altiarchaeales archaeon WOR_SM1_79]|nr:MAG: 50S ribosomal protein L4 [Candidatus Altiarchaeales archaeon WOR_SM1_79]
MVKVYSLTGKSTGEIELPEVFKTPYRPDLIQRAVVAIRSRRRQVHATDPSAGLKTSAAYFGSRRRSYRQTINKEMSRLPREKPGGGGLGRVRIVPQSVKGRVAHPPKNKDWGEKINNKEYKFALKSAIASTADPGLVSSRGHIVDTEELPLVVSDEFESLEKTKDVIKLLNALRLDKDLKRAKKRSIRGGKGTMRGRKYKTKKSVLLVVNEDKGIKKGASNIPGVEVATVADLNPELLAPGAHAGRLTLYTKAAIENISSVI